MKTTVNATLTKSIKKYEDYHYLVKSSSDPPIGTILLQYFFFFTFTQVTLMDMNAYTSTVDGTV